MKIKKINLKNSKIFQREEQQGNKITKKKQERKEKEKKEYKQKRNTDRPTFNINNYIKFSSLKEKNHSHIT